MFKRILVGVLWTLLFYFGICILIGGIVGGIAGLENPQAAAKSGAIAGAKAVAGLRGYILLASALIAAIGMWKRVLPSLRRTLASPPPLPPNS